MKALTKGLMTIALLAATAACDGSPTGASAFSAGDGFSAAQAPAPSGVLTFSSTQSYSEETPQTASGGVAGIDFTGSLTTGTPCVTVTATHSARRNDVTVTVTATSTGGICTQVITHNNYTGRVSGLAAGTYDFTVIHRNGNTSTTAYASTVTVQ
jgi:hypothetical protein